MTPRLEVIADNYRRIGAFYGGRWFIAANWKPTCFVVGFEFVRSKEGGDALCAFVGPLLFIFGALHRKDEA